MINILILFIFYIYLFSFFLLLTGADACHQLLTAVITRERLSIAVE